jgi:hypothetical protein
MKRIGYRPGRLHIYLKKRWPFPVDAAQKKRSSHGKVSAYLKEMWENYLNFTRQDF